MSSRELSLVNATLKIAATNDHEDFLYELKQNHLLHSISNKVLNLFENKYKSIGFVCLSQNSLQQELIFSLTKLLSRKKETKKTDVYLSHDKKGLDSSLDYLLNDKIYLKDMSDATGSGFDLKEDQSLSDQRIWDLPYMGLLVKSYELYMPILEDIDVVFVLVSSKGTNKDEVIALREYFQNFDIEVQGLVLEKKKTHSWWEFWK